MPTAKAQMMKKGHRVGVVGVEVGSPAVMALVVVKGSREVPVSR